VSCKVRSGTNRLMTEKSAFWNEFAVLQFEYDGQHFKWAKSDNIQAAGNFPLVAMIENLQEAANRNG